MVHDRSRRKAPVADRGLGRLDWADSAPPQEGPESEPKPPFHCEREIGFIARSGRSYKPADSPRSAAVGPVQ